MKLTNGYWNRRLKLMKLMNEQESSWSWWTDTEIDRDRRMNITHSREGMQAPQLPSCLDPPRQDRTFGPWSTMNLGHIWHKTYVSMRARLDVWVWKCYELEADLRAERCQFASKIGRLDLIAQWTWGRSDSGEMSVCFIQQDSLQDTDRMRTETKAEFGYQASFGLASE